MYTQRRTMEASDLARRVLTSLIFFFLLHASARSDNPLPNPDSVVQVGQARFTVLTSHLIRMEWGGQVDAATFVFVNRYLPKPDFTVSSEQGWHVIQTSAVKVRIKNKNRYFIWRIFSAVFSYMHFARTKKWFWRKVYIYIKVLLCIYVGMVLHISLLHAFIWIIFHVVCTSVHTKNWQTGARKTHSHACIIHCGEVLSISW